MITVASDPISGIVNIMQHLDRISFNPAVMGGKPCIKGTRVTVGTIVGLIASGHSTAKVLELYPYLTAADVTQSLSYAAWRSEEIEVPLQPA